MLKRKLNDRIVYALLVSKFEDNRSHIWIDGGREKKGTTAELLIILDSRQEIIR
jgi:hypothetical protein